MPLDPARYALANGSIVLVKENRTTPAVSVLAAVPAGAYDDPPGRDGTAALTARVLDRGTLTRSRDAIADELDRRGASLGVAASRHLMSVNATCLAEDLGPVLSLIADILQHPAFPDDDVTTRRAELITTIRQAEDDPASVAADAFMAELYAGHPYARRVRGAIPSVERLERADLQAFHAARFTPAALILAVVGDVETAAVFDRASRELGQWTAAATGFGTPQVPDPTGARHRRLRSIPMMNKSQTDVVYGFVGLRRRDPDYYAAAVMNNALGQYAMGGRLGDSIRERQGMAYYVSSDLDAGLGAGPLMIRAGVAAANVEKTIASIDHELTVVLADGLPRKDVEDSKRFLVGSLPRQLETNAAIASFLLAVELYGLGLDFDARYSSLIDAVAPEAATAAARRLFDPSRATIAVAGPWSAPSSSTSTSP
jgi:zinc protease